ncbi:FAD-dependent oxidoreductase [Nitrosococcus wardiae]|uniref:FAD-binding protein n=1 Tax=Nitrosococcus wardiae TaxID=1814290 RepID=A0A4P7C2U7_9GAMM|nr:FAD-dependent monooxygenase [Nitrosococcus wardiae]QBQ55202.1 FAD-binding protein [Nitrosococcus wardiae]
MRNSRGHAVVIGASIAGLLAARVLQNHFQRVTLVDKDIETPSPRKGVPQGRHGHVLLANGTTVLAKQFPELFADLVAQGSTVVDISTEELQWFHHGAWRLPPSTKILGYSQTRPFLEWHLKRHLALHHPVQFLTATSVVGLQTDAQKQRVTGVRIRPKNKGTVATLAADMVIDASGRGSRTPKWREALGYPRPEETRVGIYLGYGSRLYQPPPDFKSDWKILAVYPQAPSSTKFGVIFPVEGTRLGTLPSPC